MTAENLTAFLPDPYRAAALDARMHAELQASLAHLGAAAAAAAPEIARACDRQIALLTAGARVPPATFGLYYELAQRLFDDDLPAALTAAAMLAQQGPRAPGLAMLRRGGPEAAPLEKVFDLRLGPEAGRYAPIDAAMHADFAALVREGLDLLARGFAPLHAEITTILSQMLFAQAPAGARVEFDGSSHYQFWGLLLLNPRHHKTPLAVAEVLAHEAGHSLLFGLTVDEPLVLNPDAELFASPLRRDPRPMDGIFHATFVSARMALAMEVLADSGLLSPAERDAATRAAGQDRANFAAGLGTIRAGGRLSPTGALILENARAWVQAC